MNRQSEPRLVPAATPVGISLVVNGRERTGVAEPRTLLSDFLRHELGLTGTHVGCEQGACGACTVLRDGIPIRSCLMFAVQAEGARIETIEGMADGDDLHPIQAAFRTKHGLQCGFCTPGMVLTVSALLAGNPKPSEFEIRDYLSGNICRCTGYGGIIRGGAGGGWLRRERRGAGVIVHQLRPRSSYTGRAVEGGGPEVPHRSRELCGRPRGARHVARRFHALAVPRTRGSSASTPARRGRCPASSLC